MTTKRNILLVLRHKATVPSFALLSLLAACGEMPTREESITNLDNAPVCCQALSEIHYAAFPSDTSEFIFINEQSPAFVFGTGKCHFVAFNLPDHPLPYRLSVKSYAVGLHAGKPHCAFDRPSMTERATSLSLCCAVCRKQRLIFT